MKYPIDPATFLANSHAEHGADAVLDKICRICVQRINGAYYAGRSSRPGWPKSPEEEISADPMCDSVKPIAAALIRCENAAYAQGREDAGRGAA